jgi:type II secretory pathway component PulF
MVELEVPMPEAILRAGQASSDPLLEKQSRTIREQLEQGRPLGVVLRGKGMLPEWVAWMTLAGERQGTLAATLRQVAENYRRQVEGRAAVLRNVMPPIFVLLTAGVLGLGFFVTFALPLFRLLEGLSK